MWIGRRGGQGRSLREGSGMDVHTAIFEHERLSSLLDRMDTVGMNTSRTSSVYIDESQI